MHVICEVLKTSLLLGKTYGLIEGKADSELMVAVKTLKEGSSTEIKEDFIQEVALMSVLHHENIVELLAVSMDEEPYGMIFEFMDLGDLNQYLRKAGPFFEGDEKEKGLVEVNYGQATFRKTLYDHEFLLELYTCYYEEITAVPCQEIRLLIKRVEYVLLVTQ